jgi:hypothetical protein
MKASEREPYTYFQPGEVLLLLTHESDERIDVQINNEEGYRPDNIQSKDEKSPQSFDSIIDAWISDIDNMAKQQNDRLTIIRRKDRELHFAGTLTRQVPPSQGINFTRSKNKPPELKKQGAFSLIPAEVRLPTNDRAVGPELVGLMTNLESRRKDLEESFNNKRRVPPAGLRLETKVDTIMLNWLSTPCSEWGGGGGPGGLPEPYQEVSGHIPYLFNIPTAQSLLEAKGSNQGKGVTVAILDTAPSLHDMAAAYERYHKVNPANREESHPLIETLLKPNGRLHVHPASIDDLMRMRAIHLRDHDYDMSDHGLFVAGIIHTIAPEAEIHLYEVLNPSGVGDLLSIAKGLREVLDRFSGQPLVVNCSLVLNIPLLNQPITDLPSDLLALFVNDPNKLLGQGYLTSDGYQDGKAWLARQAQAIELVCNQLLWDGSRVIAAAGNDWRSSEETRPQARFPAAFDSVLGVGALPKNAQVDTNNRYLPASYSNLSDEPEESGVATLGGESGENNGILGVYLGKFPPMKFWLQKYPVLLRPFIWLILAIRWGSFYGPKNKNNWASWSGTSFATPIVTGIVASVLSDLGQPATIEDAIGQLYTTSSIEESITVRAEDGIAGVQQV